MFASLMFKIKGGGGGEKEGERHGVYENGTVNSFLCKDSCFI